MTSETEGKWERGNISLLLCPLTHSLVDSCVCGESGAGGVERWTCNLSMWGKCSDWLSYTWPGPPWSFLPCGNVRMLIICLKYNTQWFLMKQIHLYFTANFSFPTSVTKSKWKEQQFKTVLIIVIAILESPHQRPVVMMPGPRSQFLSTEFLAFT